MGMAVSSDAARDGDDATVVAVRFDLEAFFAAHYGRVTGIIARVVRDPSRAEELAVDVFLKLWREPRAQGDRAAG